MSVVSERLADRMGAESIAIGTTLTLNGTQTTVIGIVPRSFKGIDMRTVDVWVPLVHFAAIEHSASAEAVMSDRDIRWLDVVARVRPSVTIQQAQEQLSTALQGNHRLEFTRLTRFPPQVQSLMDVISLILHSCVALVMLISIANVAGLTFAHNLRRRREFAIRMALGCGRLRLAWLVLLGGAALGIVALAIAIPLSQLMLLLILHYGLPDGMSDMLDGVTLLRAPVLIAAVALGPTAGMVAALVPAIRLSRTAAAHTLQQLSAGVIGGLARPSRFVVAFQTAMAVALLLNLGLLLQSRNAILGTPTGFDGVGVSFAMVEPKQMGYEGRRAIQFIDNLSKRLETVPEITAFALARQAVLQGAGWSHRILDGPSGDMGLVGYNVVSENYFDFFGLTPTEGRVFDRRDDGESGRVMVVNETLAGLWGGPEKALGAMVRLVGESDFRMVVGIVKDVKYQRLRQASRAYFYLPLTQTFPLPGTNVAVHFRTRASPRAAEAELKRVVSDLEPDLAVFGFSSLEDWIAREARTQSLLAAFVSVVTAMALVLVCLGLNAALTQAVGHAQKEMALRLALGSGYWRLQWLLSWRLLSSVAIGVALGWAVGTLFASVLNPVLVDASIVHPGTIAMVLATVAVCTLIGLIGQLRRIGAVAPSAVLRES